MAALEQRTMHGSISVNSRKCFARCMAGKGPTIGKKILVSQQGSEKKRTSQGVRLKASNISHTAIGCIRHWYLANFYLCLFSLNGRDDLSLVLACSELQVPYALPCA